MNLNVIDHDNRLIHRYRERQECHSVVAVTIGSNESAEEE